MGGGGGGEGGGAGPALPPNCWGRLIVDQPRLLGKGKT